MIMKDDTIFRNEYRNEIDSFRPVSLDELKGKILNRAARHRRGAKLCYRTAFAAAVCGLLFLAGREYMNAPERAISAANEETPLSYAGELTVALRPIHYVTMNTETGMCGMYYLNLDCKGEDFTEVRIEIELPEQASDKKGTDADAWLMESVLKENTAGLTADLQEKNPGFFCIIDLGEGLEEVVYYKGSSFVVPFDELDEHAYGLAVNFREVGNDLLQIPEVSLRMTAFREDGSFVSEETRIEAGVAEDYELDKHIFEEM